MPIFNGKFFDKHLQLLYVHFQGVQNVAMILNCNTMKTLDNSVGVIFAKINDVNAYILDSNNGIKIQL